MDYRSFWYAIADSRDLRRNTVIGAQLLGESLALFRDETGKAVAIEDRCLHRAAPLSRGRVRQGRLQCAYHGWTYAGAGCVVHVPSEGPNGLKNTGRCARTFATAEVDDYVYVRLSEATADDLPPFRIPHYRERGWAAIRLKNTFHNNVTNCVENFVDIPHTAFVHPRIFRVTRNERFTAQVTRRNGSVVVEYHNERANLGVFTWFLNPRRREIRHIDAFHMPNVTSVDYDFGPRRRFIITSQSVPISDDETLVYTDLTYNYSAWNSLARPIIRRQAQTIINQDIEILNNQMMTIKKYGAQFSNTAADVIHVMIEAIREALAEGRDPRLLPDKTHEIEFWV
jgi:Phenylpropionate dioxygenase and related ring-hydroxylating dioxygenases, large terminal subunit